MPSLSPDEQRMIGEMAERHRVSPDVVLTLLAALRAGGGGQAQFNHPELGGMGQWSRGGMIMIGDMLNIALKARVDGLCRELSTWLSRTQDCPSSPAQLQGQSQGRSVASFSTAGSGPSWWPSELGTPATSGAQNDLRYAYFPRARCLAINHQGRITLHNTGEHQISGVSQQQGGGQSITFTSQHGVVRLADLPPFEPDAEDWEPKLPEAKRNQTQQDVQSASARAAPLSARPDRTDTPPEDIVVLIERLAELRRKGVLTEEEFTAKKAELLSRL